MAEGPMTKHQHLAQTGRFEKQAHGGPVSTHEHHSSKHAGGHTSMKHSQHVGHGTHGHKGPHEHHTNPGHHAKSGGTGHGIHTAIHAEPMHVSTPYTDTLGTDGGGGSRHGKGGGTGGTRNPV